MTWTGPFARAFRAADRAVGRALGPRRVIVDVRNPMHVAVLDPITTALARDRRVDVWFTSPRLSVVRGALAHVPSDRVLSREAAARRRWDLYLSADPWERPTLRRCARWANVFHGVAGKYDLDDPKHLPIEFDGFDRVLFINRDRMDRYIARGVLSESRARLVGFPKIDQLVNGGYDGAAVRRRFALEEGRPTALYAPTWSVASSLHLAGESIIRTLADEGLNVFVKLHPLSLDLDVVKYSGGIDWRARMRALEHRGRIVHVEDRDASPLLAASDLLVTDHSTIGFEFCLLDRPVIVYDAPDLIEVARINAERVAQLRRAADVVDSVVALRDAVRTARACPDRLSHERRRIGAEMFFDPGRATERALAVVYDVLDLPPLTSPVVDRLSASTPAPEPEHAYATRS